MSGTAGITVASLGETGVLRRILPRFRNADAARVGPGDDCAVLGVSGEAVMTTDTMIEGADFRLDWHRGYELGWKLAATNLSDVAAMGASPTALTVAFACPKDTPVELLDDIARGLDAACGELAPGCGVVGGDLSRSPVFTAAVTAFGELDGRRPVLRSGARAGDVLAYAGPLGLASVGLRLLADAGASPDQLRRDHPVAIAAQLAPRPPIHLGTAASDGRATAMIDISDGLALDSSRIARASGVVLNMEGALLVAAFGNQDDVTVPLEAMLFGGEDHGLLATFPHGGELPGGFHRIGEAREAVEGADVLVPAILLDDEPCEARGWDPFAR